MLGRSHDSEFLGQPPEENLMSTTMLRVIARAALALVATLSACHGWAQDAKPLYPAMAPFRQYGMERNAEITPARSAAPPAISGDARILVLGPAGYETAVEGKNRLVCLVERSSMAGFDSVEFWNPNIRAPICFNPPAARSILPISYKRAQLAIAGKSKAPIVEACRAAFARKDLPALEPGSMSSMMSRGAYLPDQGDHHLAHLMFYTPAMAGKAWAADLPNSSVMLGNQFTPAEPVSVFVVPVPKCSDGTAAQYGLNLRPTGKEKTLNGGKRLFQSAFHRGALG
jgi:hypothetical protein